MAQYTYTTLADYTDNGPLMKNIGPYQVTVLTANYLGGDYSNFLRLALSYINAEIQAIENSAAENSQIELNMPNLNGQASNLASKLNQQANQGNLRFNGEIITPWPGASNIAFVQDANTMIVRWVKKGPFLYIVIFALVAILGFAIYQLMQQSNYNVKLRKVLQQNGITPPPPSGSGANNQGTGTPGIGGLASGFFGWVLSHPIEAGGIALAAVATPYVITEVAKTRESINQYHAAEHGYFPRGGG